MTTVTQDAFAIDRGDGLAVLSFNRPQAGNAIPAAAVPMLLDFVTEIRDAPDVRVLLVRGEGKNFSAGGDLNAFRQSIDQEPNQRAEDFGDRLSRLNQLAEAYLELEIPIVAACRGGVAGAGMLFALGADIVLADETARFVFAQQRVGLSPDGAISYLLPRIVGLRLAKELVLTGATVPSDEASKLGLVSRIVDGAVLEDEARAVAVKLARAPVGPTRRAKALLNSSLAATLREQLAGERAGIIESVKNADFEEGVRALLEKRHPAFPSTQ